MRKISNISLKDLDFDNDVLEKTIAININDDI